HPRLPLEACDATAHPDALAPVERLGVWRQAAEEREQEHGTEAARIVRCELEDAGVAGAARGGHLALDGDEVSHMAGRVLPRDHGRRGATCESGEHEGTADDGDETLHGASPLATCSRRAAPEVSASSHSGER